MHLPGSRSGSPTGDSILARLLGEQLTQVWFVTDYLQLIFGADDTLQCFVWPKVETPTGTLTISTPGYRDGLCAFLMTEVTAVEEHPEVGLAVGFASCRLVLAPTRDELRGPEIAMFSELFASDGNWHVWEPGDEIFPHLA